MKGMKDMGMVSISMLLKTIKKVNMKDMKVNGKMVFETEWLLFMMSSTENILRVLSKRILLTVQVFFTTLRILIK